MYDVLNYVSPIPFYKSKESLDRMNEYSFGETYHNMIYADGTNVHVPSFLLHTTVPTGQASSVTALIRSDKDSQTYRQIAAANLSMVNDAGLLTVVCRESTVADLPQGPYTIELFVNLTTAGTETFYSDTVFITANIMNYVKIEWHNEYDLSVAGRTIPFTEGFRPSCYVATHIGKPEYRFEEESTSRLGYDFIESVLSKKTFRFVFVLPEYLCDALRLAKLCHVKSVTRYDLPNYGKRYLPMNISLDMEWEEQGNLAGVTCTFDVDNVLNNTSGYLPGNGDFNNDYNNDFNNI